MGVKGNTGFDHAVDATMLPLHDERHAVKYLSAVRHCGMVTAMTDDGDLLTSAQAAAILGVSARTIHRRVEDKTLVPAAHIQAGRNGTFLFRRADIEALAEREHVA